MRKKRWGESRKEFVINYELIFNTIKNSFSLIEAYEILYGTQKIRMSYPSFTNFVRMFNLNSKYNFCSVSEKKIVPITTTAMAKAKIESIASPVALSEAEVKPEKKFKAITAITSEDLQSDKAERREEEKYSQGLLINNS